MIRALILSSILFFVFSTCLFVGAGTFSWPMGWVVLGIYFAFKIAGYVLLDPALIEERAAPAEVADRLEVLFAAIGFLALYPVTYAVAGIDAVRFGNSYIPSLVVPGIALVIHFLGYCFAFWAVLANPFFSSVVRIQDDRGQTVVSTGPYAIVRHPGYAGEFVAHLALPFIFDSMWAFVPTVIGFIFFVMRTLREERMLELHLDGYVEYQERVRWRLLPGIW